MVMIEQVVTFFQYKQVVANMQVPVISYSFHGGINGAIVSFK